MASVSAATMSSPGIGSGLDVNSIVSQLVAIERQPIALLQQQAASVQTKISTYGQLQSAISSLHDAAAALTSSDTWGQATGTSSDTSAVNVTTDTSASGSAQSGNYNVQVNAVASAQTNFTGVYASADSLVGTGSLSIELGAWTGSSFSPKASASAVNITVGSPGLTLAQLRDQINVSNAGVTASVVTDTSGARLVLRSTSTGAQNGFRVSVVDTDGDNSDASGLSALAYDPQAGISTMTRAQAAADASAVINGMTVTSASNTLSGVIDGITLSLSKVTTSAVQVNVAQDTSAIKNKVDAFVTAYNAVNTLLATQTKYDAASKTAGVLQGDSAALGIRSQLRNMLGATGSASSVFTRLSDVGFDVQTDGSIKMNSTKLDSALTNVSELQKLFAKNDLATPANDGIVLQLSNLADAMLGTDGTLQTRTQGLQKSLDSNQAQQTNLDDRATAFEARLRAQYTALDTKMSQLNALASFVTQQFAPAKTGSN